MFTRMTLRHEIWRQRSRREELPKTLEDQIELGEEGLAQEDEYLLDINLDDADILTHLQKIRLLARIVYQIRGNNGIDRAAFLLPSCLSLSLH
eukprot:scaffold97650_cov58-Cyclotella_meneghiniana.AAC.2